MKKTLDFICIGAPKSATSTLFELVKDHPEIYIPPAKEVPYFNDDLVYDKGWDWYMKTFFSDAKDSQVIGTMTPQYMSGLGNNTPERISERIYAQSSKTRIVVLLRNPIGRSHSHYKMHLRNGYIDESFESAVDRLLGSANLDEERSNLSQKNMFLFASEYGRIMKSYYDKFPAKNILVLYTDDLKKDPGSVLTRLFNFLGVDGSYTPQDITRETHRGGSKAKIKYLTPAYLQKMPIIDFMWRKLVPPTLRKKIFMKITRWNIKTDNAQLDPDSAVYKRLEQYFRDDIALLESVSKQKVPWKNW